MLTNNYYALLRAYLGCVAAQNTGVLVLDTDGTERDVFTKADNYGIQSIMPDYYANYTSATEAVGFHFGDGETPPTKEDIKLSGNRITSIEISGRTMACAASGDTATTTITFTVKNTGGEAITIREVAHMVRVYYGSSGNKPVMVDRVLLDSPVTIPAGGQGVVVYRRSVTI